MESNTPGYVDFVDQFGRYLGTGAATPANAAYIRRWSIEPLPTNPSLAGLAKEFMEHLLATVRAGAIDGHPAAGHHIQALARLPFGEQPRARVHRARHRALRHGLQG